MASAGDRGYGTRHRAIRARLLAAWKPGDPCARCGQPMLYRWIRKPDGTRVSAIDLGHVDGDKASYSGLEHAACNRAAGGRQGAAITNRARAAARPFITSRDW